jgi:hypothetical protein
MAATNVVPQGTLNRLQANVVCANRPGLNVYSGYLGTDGIRLSFETNATDLLPTMTGMVTSPAPYQACTLTIAIVKSTYMADNYKNAIESDTYVGEVTVYPDVPPGGSNLINEVGANGGLGPFTLRNMAIETVREMSFAGLEATTVVTMRGYRLVNQTLFSGSPVGLNQTI